MTKIKRKIILGLIVLPFLLGSLLYVYNLEHHTDAMVNADMLREVEDLMREPTLEAIMEEQAREAIMKKTGSPVEIYRCGLQICMYPSWIDICETNHGVFRVLYSPGRKNYEPLEIIVTSKEEKFPWEFSFNGASQWYYEQATPASIPFTVYGWAMAMGYDGPWSKH